MVIENILKTLSDSEITAIALQLANSNIDEQNIYAQLIGKSNNGETKEDLFMEMNSDEFRGTLPRLVGKELALRYLEVLRES